MQSAYTNGVNLTTLFGKQLTLAVLMSATKIRQMLVVLDITGESNIKAV